MTGIPRPLKVLVVDDDQTINREVEMKLAKAGFRTETAFNGREALDAVGKGPFDLIVLDLVMPDMTGFEAISAIRGQGITTPIVVISKLQQPEDVEKVMKLGANEFFSKGANFGDQLVEYAVKLSTS